MRKYRMRYICLIAVLSLTGCTTTGGMSKEGIGTLLGAAGGATAGYLSDKDKPENIFIGMIAGTVIGNRIGAMLDERDRLALEQKTKQVLDSAGKGETVVWNSDHSGASAEIIPIEDREIERPVTIKKAPEVVITTSPVTAQSGTFRTVCPLNVGNGPGKSYAIVKTLPVNAEVTMYGITEKNWIMIGKNGVVLGYSYGKYLTEISKHLQAPPTQPAVTDEQTHLTQHSPGEKPARTATAPLYQETTAIMKVKCRTVIVRTKINGKIKEEQVKTCQDSNGSWGA